MAQYSLHLYVIANYKDILIPTITLSKQIGMGLNYMRKHKERYENKIFGQFSNNIRCEECILKHVALTRDNYNYYIYYYNKYAYVSKKLITSLITLEALKIGAKIYNYDKDRYRAI